MLPRERFTQGSKLMQPLAFAVVGGRALSTVLTLFVVPCAYVIFNGAGERLRGWLTGGSELQSGPMGAAAPAGD